MAALSAAQRAALEYLNHLMEAPAVSIGRVVHKAAPGKGSFLASVGGTTCRHLKAKGLVTFVSDLRAWRITAAGRAALQAGPARHQ